MPWSPSTLPAVAPDCGYRPIARLSRSGGLPAAGLRRSATSPAAVSASPRDPQPLPSSQHGGGRNQEPTPSTRCGEYPETAGDQEVRRYIHAHGSLPQYGPPKVGEVARFHRGYRSRCQ
jgi:hypothetical protein